MVFMGVEVSQRSNHGASRRGTLVQVAVFTGLFILLQYRMELLAVVLPGGPVYSPAVHGEVVLLSTEGCRYCASEKRYLARYDIPYTEYDVADDPRGAELLALSGRYTVPVLLIGDEVVSGFDPLRIRRAFAEAAEGAQKP
jgi:glutaredoxin